MSPTLIFYSLFYLALFIVVCMVLSTCIVRIIQMLYSCRATMLHLLGEDDEEREAMNKHIRERIREALSKK